AGDMGPADLAQAAQDLAGEFNAEFAVTVGEELLERNYPAIHAVGRAAAVAPRLIDMRWGDPGHPRVTLVGKGVCFDTGGLDLKPSRGMALMKKDMGGAATVLGLARMIMATGLPVRLRVLVPAVENSVSGNAMRPRDILQTRKGLTVEVGNTDAEGRLVLADALTEAMTDKPDLLLDFATLTGAARAAVGTGIAAMFTPDDNLAADLYRHSVVEDDPVWRLPLWKPYRRMIDSKVADINNSGDSPYAGAITAALFLSEFVDEGLSWAHFDIMAWNPSPRPGRPEGGEAMAMRAAFSAIKERYGK
ncbi:MAG: leucyl aminopeptidase family protein, partial [Alphaproteobacteria bacterium]|nr:leucyl aminopeptidase family protein [Alphaproteobacteria bacterium]